MLKELLIIIAMTFTPLIELRGSIPYGILVYDMPVWLVFLTVVVANIIAAVIVYFLLDRIILFIQRFPRLNRFYQNRVDKIQKKIKKSVDRWGWIALALFIGIPLPMSGVFSGAIAGEIIGIDFKKFIISASIGVCIAAIIVTVITLSGQGLAGIFIKTV